MPAKNLAPADPPLPIMLLEPNIKITPYDAERFVLDNGKGRYFLINENVRDLVLVLSRSESWESAHEEIEAGDEPGASVEDFRTMVRNLLADKHILVGDSDLAGPADRPRFLRLRLTLLPGPIAKRLIRPLTPLFFKRHFTAVFFISLLFAVLVSVLHDAVPDSTVQEMWIVMTLYMLSILLHELGHLAACHKFGAEHGGVGVGFYFIFPVMWADVHGIWMLPKKERIITNLAGIYMQFLVSITLGLVYTIRPWPGLIYAIYLICGSALFQLWPFIRLDGYWVISDLLDTPNLMKTSGQALKSRAKRILHIDKSQPKTGTFKDTLLQLYAFFNFAILTIYLIFVLVLFHKALIAFPARGWAILSTLFRGRLPAGEQVIEFGIVGLFYFLAIRYLYRAFKRYKHLLPGWRYMWNHTTR